MMPKYSYLDRLTKYSEIIMHKMMTTYQFWKYVFIVAEEQALREIFTAISILAVSSELFELTDITMVKGISGLQSPLDT